MNPGLIHTGLFHFPTFTFGESVGLRHDGDAILTPFGSHGQVPRGMGGLIKRSFTWDDDWIESHKTDNVSDVGKVAMGMGRTKY